jgi:hypothetical protein
MSFATKQDIDLLSKHISKSKADIIKWMFLFWVGQVAATIAVVKLLH